MKNKITDNRKVLIALILVLVIICGILTGAIFTLVSVRLFPQNEEVITEENKTRIEPEAEEFSDIMPDNGNHGNYEKPSEAVSVPVTSRNDSSSSDVLTKEILMSRSWYIEMQWSAEYIFLEDGTYECYGAKYITGTYSIDGNYLCFDNHELEYTSIAERSDIRKDDYFMTFAKNKNVDENEKIFYTTSSDKPMWLIDATNRLNEHRYYSIYRTFSIEENDKYADDKYPYFGFSMYFADEDAMPLLIYHKGTCEDDRTYSFYTVRDKKPYLLGCVSATHSTLFACDDGLFKYIGTPGEDMYFTIDFVNDSIIETKEDSFTFPLFHDFSNEMTFDPIIY